MAAARHLALLTYDVSHDRDRARLSAYLQEHMTRVQGSVFEGWLTQAEAARIGARAAALVGEEASVRLYIVPRGGVGACRAWGFPPGPCADGALIV